MIDRLLYARFMVAITVWNLLFGSAVHLAWVSYSPWLRNRENPKKMKSKPAKIGSFNA